MKKDKRNKSIQKLNKDFEDSGYYGTTLEHQLWLRDLLNYIDKLESRIKYLEEDTGTSNGVPQ